MVMLLNTLDCIPLQNACPHFTGARVIFRMPPYLFLVFSKSGSISYAVRGHNNLLSMFITQNSAGQIVKQ